MPQFKNSMMVCDTKRRVATTAGHVIVFEPGKETFVPALAVQACRDAGARVTKQAAGTGQNLPAPGSKGRIRHEVTIMEDDLDAEEVENFDPDDFDFSSEEEEKPKTKVFTEAEERVRQGIKRMLTDSLPEHWTNNNRPKTSALSRVVEGMSVNGNLRDRVWDKMESQGEIPEDFAYLLGL